MHIPRLNMLMRWAEVAPNGTFSVKGNPVLSYNTLIGERVFSVMGAAIPVAKGTLLFYYRVMYTRMEGKITGRFLSCNNCNALFCGSKTRCQQAVHYGLPKPVLLLAAGAVWRIQLSVCVPAADRSMALYACHAE